ncbi:hypothetical protein F7725_015505 [Dissostichus mawsoni]|uniref:4Fe-4S ferredoxin-type domain-containing protein n=1 Tax=Dissostichus mawsoni TaxID=36200 RepID=A0A7J5YL41_DISMA|nr:hypothetical protein F7725_015505 [Dissostichus mawsoni]
MSNSFTSPSVSPPYSPLTGYGASSSALCIGNEMANLLTQSQFFCTDRQSSSSPPPPPPPSPLLCPQCEACQVLCPANSIVLGTPRPRAGVNLPAPPKELREQHKGLKETCQHGYRLKYPRPFLPPSSDRFMDHLYGTHQDLMGFDDVDMMGVEWRLPSSSVNNGSLVETTARAEAGMEFHLCQIYSVEALTENPTIAVLAGGNFTVPKLSESNMGFGVLGVFLGLLLEVSTHGPNAVPRTSWRHQGTCNPKPLAPGTTKESQTQALRWACHQSQH